MKKFYIMLAALLLLSACGKQTVKVDKMTEDEGQVVESDSGNQEQAEEKDGEEQVVTDQKQQNDDEAEEQVEPQYRMNEQNYALEPIGDSNPKVVLFTIDDAPDKYAMEMANTLKRLNTPAIFFINGHFIHSPEKEQIIKDIHNLGFEIGNHTYSHPDLTALSPEKQREEIISVNDKIEELTGERPKFFRAPFGKNTDISRQIAAEENMLVMNWTYGYDWDKQYMTKDAIADIMVNTELLRDGANMLMHDREWTNTGLEQMIVGLRNKGYEFLNPELIETPAP